MRVFSSESQKIGEIGEGVACKYMISKDYEIIERNYTRKWGEIDIVAEKDGVTHFVEVKSVSQANLNDLNREVRPEDNMHQQKIERLKRVIETYLSDRKIGEKQKWVFDLACVYLDVANKKAKVEMMEELIL